MIITIDHYLICYLSLNLNVLCHVSQLTWNEITRLLCTEQEFAPVNMKTNMAENHLFKRSYTFQGNILVQTQKKVYERCMTSNSKFLLIFVICTLPLLLIDPATCFE